MTNINLNRPYKIVVPKQKRYAQHYDIPAAECLIVPTKRYDEDLSCDIRWQDNNGELHVLSQKIISAENLIPLNPLLDNDLFEIWQHYYSDN